LFPNALALFFKGTKTNWKQIPRHIHKNTNVITVDYVT
jgi:hypothetical protein